MAIANFLILNNGQRPTRLSWFHHILDYSESFVFFYIRILKYSESNFYWAKSLQKFGIYVTNTPLGVGSRFCARCSCFRIAASFRGTAKPGFSLIDTTSSFLGTLSRFSWWPVVALCACPRVARRARCTGQWTCTTWWLIGSRYVCLCVCKASCMCVCCSSLGWGASSD